MARGNDATKFSKARQPKKRKPRGPNKFPFSARAALEKVCLEHGHDLQNAIVTGLRSGPKTSPSFVKIVAEYGLGKPLEMAKPLVRDPNERRGLVIEMTRPLGTDPLAEGPRIEPLGHVQASKEPAPPGPLARAAAALVAPRRPKIQPQVDPHQPRTIEIDGEEAEVE